MGTLLYWLMVTVHPAPKLFSPSNIAQQEPIINTENSNGGFEYSDAYLHDNDARFIFNFIRSAMDSDCAAANYVESGEQSSKRGSGTPQAFDSVNQETFTLTLKVLINARPLLMEHNQHTINKPSTTMFSKGIHLIVDRLTSSQRVLTFLRMMAVVLL